MKFIRVSAKEWVNIDYLFEVAANFIIEKTIAKKIKFAKSKTNNLLLTYFNNCNSKTSKKKLGINNRTCSNNSMKNQKNVQNANNTNNYNYIYITK